MHIIHTMSNVYVTVPFYLVLRVVFTGSEFWSLTLLHLFI